MFTHKGITYYLGYSSGKFTINIPGLKYFKEVSFKKWTDADLKAKTIIENEISRISQK